MFDWPPPPNYPVTHPIQRDGHATTGEYSIKLWDLVEAHADSPEALERTATAIHDDPHCMMDSFASEFLKHFCTVDKLIADACIVTLIAIGILARFDNIPIECKFALIRRILLMHSNTHAERFSLLSADWLLAMARILCGGNARKAAEGTAPSQCSEPRTRKGRHSTEKRQAPKGYTHNGGTQRAAYSEILAGQPMKGPLRKPAFKRAARIFEQAMSTPGDPRAARWIEAGKALRLSSSAAKRLCLSRRKRLSFCNGRVAAPCANAKKTKVQAAATGGSNGSEIMLFKTCVEARIKDLAKGLGSCFQKR